MSMMCDKNRECKHLGWGGPVISPLILLISSSSSSLQVISDLKLALGQHPEEGAASLPQLKRKTLNRDI